MTSLLTLVLILLACGISSIALFGVCAWFIFALVIGHALGGGSIWEIPLAILAGVGLILSLAICPLGAYYFRNSIFELTESVPLRLLLFVLIGGFQVVILSASYTSIKVYATILEHERTSRTRAQRDIIQQLRNANVDVTVTQAKIVDDNSKLIKVEVTLKIERMPLTVPYYEIYISRINNESGEFFVEPYLPFSPIKPKPWIKAINTDGTWSFKEEGSRILETRSPNEVTFRFSFERRNTVRTKRPTTITPTFLIRWNEFNSTIGDPTLSMADSIFFDREVEINLE